MFCRRSADNRTIKTAKMKNLTLSTVVLLSIASSILSYPNWLLLWVIDLYKNDIVFYGSVCLILIAMIFACRAVYRFHNRSEDKRKARRAQIGFIFLVSLTIKSIFDAILLLTVCILVLMIPYGGDIVITAPIAIGVNLAFAKRMQKKRREIARDR